MFLGCEITYDGDDGAGDGAGTEAAEAVVVVIDLSQQVSQCSISMIASTCTLWSKYWERILT